MVNINRVAHMEEKEFNQVDMLVCIEVIEINLAMVLVQSSGKKWLLEHALLIVQTNQMGKWRFISKCTTLQVMISVLNYVA